MTDLPDRDELIALCIRGSVPQDRWRNRDSAGAQRQLGECLALLAAGCDFTVAPSIATLDGRAAEAHEDHGRTWWVDIAFKGFSYFELGPEGMETDLFYVPTDKRLNESTDHDWY